MANLTGYDKFQIISVTGNKPAAPLSWFPMLVALDADAGLNDYTQNAGLDIAFTPDGDDTELPYEREQWTDNGATITARFWVRVPSVDSASDTDLRMHIGKAAGTAYATPSDTWNENGADNFIFGHHMSDWTTTTIIDSTSNSNDGSKIGASEPIETTGQIYKGQEFDGVQDRISLGNDASLNTTEAITMECLIDWNETGDDYQRIFDKGTEAPSMYINRGGGSAIDHLGWYGEIGGIQRDSAFGDTTITAGWKYVAMTWDDADDVMRAYLNGAPDGTEVGWSGAIAATADTLYIGDRADGTRSYNGGIDEARWSKIARSAAWLLFTSDNILDYAGTITHGAWESAAQRNNFKTPWWVN